MNQDILVSVLIASFNAEKYIVQLLDSIKEQSYQKLEVVIADDCSKDDTRRLIDEWEAENGSRFVAIKKAYAMSNRGTCKNLNAGLAQCEGEYIKIIDGDDMLCPNAVEDLLTECLDKDLEVLIGDLHWVQDDGETYAEHYEDRERMKTFYAMSAEEQHRSLLVDNNVVCSAGEFFKTDFMKRFKGFEEKYDLLEDYPFWLKVTAAGVKLSFLDVKVAKYRQSTTSVKNPEVNTKIYNERISKASKKVFYDLRMKGLLKDKRYGLVARCMRRYIVRDLVIALGNSNANKVCRVLTRFE
ncbi:MAG: glycosyltransferase family 2 protein [Lachnospiraceae bacterium]|nr:glycosyltransferase family 2 protein [Lachnospiraceae bacterium]